MSKPIKDDDIRDISKLILDEYEQSIEDALTPEWFAANKITEERKEYRSNFARQSKENRQKRLISIRLAQYDIDGIKAKALAQWMSYQTLINLLIHQYVAGNIQIQIP